MNVEIVDQPAPMNLAHKDSVPERSFRRALKAWQTEDGSARFQKRVIPNSLWSALWILLDLLTWATAASLTLAILYLFANGSVFPHINTVVLPIGTALAALWMVGAYDRDTDFLSLRFAAEVCIAGILAAVIGAGLAALFGSYGRGAQTSRFFLFAAPAFFTVGCLLTRRIWWQITDHGHNDLRILVVGTPAEALRLEHALSLTDRALRVQALDPAAALDGGLENILRTHDPASVSPDTVGRDTVVIAPSAAQALSLLSPFLVALHSTTVPVYTWSAFWSQRIKTLDWGSDSADWFFEKDFRLAQSSAFSHMKRVVDFSFALVALVLSLPVVLVTWLLIRIDSPGPAIFTQPRVGLRGREFKIYKFRTMALDAEKAGTTTTKNDARITRLGGLLRKYRIDEIPQILNVLKGDMSMIGPRPEWTVCVQNYEGQLPCYHLRHLVKPGITGWAQVNYPYGEGLDDARNKLSFDLFYVAHPSIILDCSIILKTIYVLLGKVGGR